MRSGLAGVTSTLYLAGTYETHVRLKVENGSGTFIDMFGYYTSIRINNPDPKEPIGSADLSFIRDSTALGNAGSLSPLVEASDLNVDDLSAYSPLLQIGRQVTIEVNLTAVGGARPADIHAEWYEIFRGIINSVDFGALDGHIVQVQVDGLGAVLQHAKSEAEYTYVAGTSLETVVTEVLSNNGYGSVPTFWPAATGKVLPNDWAPGFQKTVWSQIDSIAKSMGWVVYYRYRGHNAPELTIFEPARGKVIADHDVYVDDFKQLAFDDSEVRNVGFLVYVDRDGVEQFIGPETDSPSLAKYGGSLSIRRPFWIKLTEDSPIRDEAEASEMLQAALSDVSDPDIVGNADTVPLVFGESGVDLYDIESRDRFFDNDQTWALFSNVINFATRTFPRSSLGLRGVPTAGVNSWRELGYRLPIDVPNAPVQPPFDNLVGYWPLDNLNGTKIYDVTSNEHDAAVGTALTTRVQGVAGMALNFPGLGSGYTLLNDADAGAIESLFYVCGWIKASNVAGADFARIIERDTLEYFSLQLRQNTAFPQNLWFGYSDTQGVTVTDAINEAGKWHFFLAQWDVANTRVELWVGQQDKELELVFSSDSLAAFAVSSRPIVLGSITGASIGTGNPFDGDMDDIRIGAGNLHKNEIEALFKFPGAAHPPKIDGDNVADTFDITAKSITADTGLIGGWSLSGSELSSGSMKLQSTAERMLLGAATAPLVGTGVFLGKDGADYEFRAGNPAADFIHWDGTDLSITGEITATSGTIGGWTISAGELSSGSVKLQSSAQRILIGAATNFRVGTGIFMGLNSGLYKFNMGVPGGEEIYWDGSNLFVTKITAVSGTVGGWTIASSTLTAGSVTIDAGGRRIMMGGVTNYLIGTGIYLGLHSGVYKIQVGNPSGNLLTWDGSTLAIKGTITATAGLIGGWTINSSTLTSGSVTIDGGNQHILMGAASAPLTGIGIFMGKDGADYEFRAGNPAAAYMHWDGTNLIVKGALITDPASGSSPSLMGWNHSLVFSPDPTNNHNTLDWTAGTIRTTDGTSYSIVAGTVVAISSINPSYFYLDTAVSTTVLQESAVQANAVGNNKILVAVALAVTSGKDLQFQVFGGQSFSGMKLVTADNILVNTITFNEIAGNTITANQIASVDLTTQSLTATVGAIGGWNLASNTLSSGGVSINSSTEQILMGASAILTGVGVFLGKDTTYKFRVGDPAGSYMMWNGIDTLAIAGDLRWINGGSASFYDSIGVLKGSITADNATSSIHAVGTWNFISASISVTPLKKVIFDGGGDEHSYIWEKTANVLEFVAGGVDALEIYGGGLTMKSGMHFEPGGTQNTYYDGTGGAKHSFVVSNTERFLINASGAFVPAGDFRITAGQLQFGGDVAMLRGSTNRLEMAAGDSFRISSTGMLQALGGLTIGGTTLDSGSIMQIEINTETTGNWAFALNNAMNAISGAYDIGLRFALSDLGGVTPGEGGKWGGIMYRGTSWANSGWMSFYTHPSTGGGVEQFRITQDGHLAMKAQARLYFDGVNASGNTYIYEDSPDNVSFIVGGVSSIQLQAGGLVISGGYIKLPATKKLYLDGGVHTYIHEQADNIVEVVSLGASAFKMTNSWCAIPNGHPLYFDGAIGGNTYIMEDAADRIAIAVGGVTNLWISAAGISTRVGGKLNLDAIGDSYLHESSPNNITIVVGGGSELSINNTRVKCFAALEIDGALNHDGSTAGFFGTVPVARPSIDIFDVETIGQALLDLGLAVEA